MIIDAHTHLGALGKNRARVTARELLASMDQAGIDHSLVIALEYYDTSTTTTSLLNACAHSDRLHVIGGVQVSGDVTGQVSKLLALYAARRIVGVKLMPGYENFYPSDQRLSPLYEQCEQREIPIIFHTGVLAAGSPGLLKQIHPLEADEVANRFPKLRIIMAHFGNPWVTDAAAVVAKNANVYVDLSGYFAEYRPIVEDDAVIFSRAVEQFTNFAGDLRKCLFGTDYPLYNQQEYLRSVQRLKLASDEADLLYWQNAAQVFKLDV